MKLSLVALFGLIVVTGSLAADPATELVAGAQLFSSSLHFQLECRLTVQDGSGDSKVRDLKIFAVREGGDRLLAQVVAPAYLKNLKFLRIQSKEATGSWLRTSRGTQRVSTDGNPEPLFGSDFTTADFQPSTRGWILLAGSDPTVTVLERPTEPREGWVKQVLTLRKADGLVLKSEFLDVGGTLVRKYSVSQFSAEGRPQVVVLEDFKQSRRSELTVTSFDDASEIPLSKFSPGNL